MTIIASRLERIAPSPTMAVTARARELKAAGVDVIDLGAGDADLDPPPAAVSGLAAAAQQREPPLLVLLPPARGPRAIRAERVQVRVRRRRCALRRRPAFARGFCAARGRWRPALDVGRQCHFQRSLARRGFGVHVLDAKTFRRLQAH